MGIQDGPLTCQECGMASPPPDQTCDGGHGGMLRDHYVGIECGCPWCGRLMLACARRPCQAMREAT